MTASASDPGRANHELRLRVTGRRAHAAATGPAVPAAPGDVPPEPPAPARSGASRCFAGSLTVSPRSPAGPRPPPLPPSLASPSLVARPSLLSPGNAAPLQLAHRRTTS